jgi:glycosyltransferase involved in cell wall biosynthesis
MRIALANANFRPNTSLGGFAHVQQFVENAVAMGHEVYAWPVTQHPLVKQVPPGKRFPYRTLRTCDVLYVRVEDTFPFAGRNATGWRRWAMGDPLVVWEFNTVPEYGLLKNRTRRMVDEAIASFRAYAHGCDLAVCVSAHLAEYVRDKLGVKHTLVVPNGSDVDVFRPDVPPVERLAKKPGQVNVLWMGAADILWHNIDLLRSACHAVTRKGAGDRIAFHIMGHGLGGMRDMPANVHYQGGEAYGNMPAWLSGMDIGTVLYRPGPADYSSPLKLYDYLASGLAVVAVDQPQVREIFTELGQLDLLVSPDDADGLADRLIALADDPNRLANLKSASRRLAVAKYTWRRAVDETFAEVERLLANRRSRRRASTSRVTNKASSSPATTAIPKS